MNRISARICAVLIAILPLAFSFVARGIRVELVTFNVIVEDQETGMPVENLGHKDFQVMDDGHLISAALFASDRSTPAKIWFLVDCPERGGIDSGSRFMAGKSSLLRPALDKLNSDDTVGVAHWCGNGDSKIDLTPTQNRDAPFGAIDAILRQLPVEPAMPAGKFALQRVLDLILDGTRFESRFALPVIVLLYDGRLAIPKDEAELMAKKLLYKRAIVYQIRRQNENFTGLDPLAQNSSLPFVSAQTGGSVFAVKDDDYRKAMGNLVDTLQSSYTLGFVPRSRDRQWHELRVQLTEAAQQKHKPVRVHFAAGYLNVGSYWSVPPYSISKYQQATNPQLDPVLTNAIDSPTVGRDIRFDANAHSFIDSTQLVEFTLQFDAGEVTWATLPNGDRQSQINIVVASFSEEGKKLKHVLVQFELLRDEVHLPITGDGPFTHTATVVLPGNVSRVRLAVRDAVTGKIGVRDFSLKEILESPKSPLPNLV